MPVEVIANTSASSWTVPANVYSVEAECWGAGGGGRAHVSTAGGGGAYSRKVVAVVPGQAIPLKIGAGGSGSDTPKDGVYQYPGGDTWFISTTTVMAKGGRSGDYTANPGRGGLASEGYGDTKFSGGSGNGTGAPNGSGGFTTGAGAGSAASPSGNGGNQIDGNGGSSPYAGAGGGNGGFFNTGASGANNVNGGGGAGGNGVNSNTTGAPPPWVGQPGAPGGGSSHMEVPGATGQIRLTYSEGAPPTDTTAPTITSAATASRPENTANPTGTLAANETVTWSKNGGADAALFSISGSTWTLNANPDYEAKASYAVVWRATDAAGNFADQAFTLNITDVVETPTDTTAPTITSSATPSVNENTVNPTGVLTANEPVTWSKTGFGGEQFGFSLSGNTWTLNTTPNFESKSSYSVEWRATDAAGNYTNQMMTLSITDVDEIAPVITSSASPSVAENTATPSGTLTANEAVTWSKVGGADQALFSLGGSTWTLNTTPDFETKTSYTVVWRATDAAGNATDQTMTLGITDVTEGGGTPGGALWTPAGMTGLLFWVKFDGLPGAQGASITAPFAATIPASGQAGTIYGNQAPTVSVGYIAPGMKAVRRGAGSNATMGTGDNLGLTGNTSRTMFTVGCIKEVGHNTTLVGYGGGGNRQGYDAWYQSGGWGVHVNSFNTQPGGGMANNVPFVAGNSYNGATRTHRAWQDGQPGGSVVDSADLNTGVNNLVILGGKLSGFSPDIVEVGEVLLFNTLLSTADTQKVEGYLAWKWAMQSKLPADHPYKAAAPTTGGAVTPTSRAQRNFSWL